MDIELTLKNYRCFSDEKPARIEIRQGFTAFLGINNSGKSSLLRFFYELRDLFWRLSSTNIVVSSNDWQMTTLVQSLNGTNQGFNFPPEILDTEEVFCNANNRDMLMQIRFTSTGRTGTVPIRLDVLIQRSTRTWTCKLYLDNTEVPSGNLWWKDYYLYQQHGQERVRIADLTDLLKVCELFASMVYLPSFRNTINVGTSAKYYDIPIGQGFISQWNTWKTNSPKILQEKAGQVQDDLAKIFNYKRLEINASPDGEKLHFMINGKSYKNSELGSGLTQFFLVLATAALRDPLPSFILIDEPEINLHPSLQLDFLTRLTAYASQGILFATHSIGLARASAERIYSVQRNTDDLSEVADYNITPRLAELLGELSFSGYKELGFDKILLVEGPTEVKTVQQFLRLYKIDHKIVLLPMGGFQMINSDAEVQLEEIKRISDNVFALIDSERSAKDEELEPKRAEFVNLCKRAGIKCHVLERRAIENYFPEDAIKKVQGNDCHALEAYEQFKSHSPRWAKSENWQIAREMKPEDLDGTDLGEFLQSL